ncbi:MAG: hypothetical protein DRJ50_10595 [Actinobacteria bacterium]|nr:MAG: hypothetical protein DRJ50_10595 [Actinomycetota bacterium]
MDACIDGGPDAPDRNRYERSGGQLDGESYRGRQVARELPAGCRCVVSIRISRQGCGLAVDQDFVLSIGSS